MMLTLVRLLIYNNVMSLENRRFCARLIQEVLAGRRLTREALKRFPKGENDRSVMAVYHALIHYEADEDIRKRDPEFREEQDLYLKSLADILLTGQPLPENIINSYEEFYSGAVLTEGKGLVQWFKSLLRFIT